MKRVTIDPITRLEGHGRIEIFLDDSGEVSNAYFQVPELRGFEKFCEGRPVEEIARITPRICGVCPEAHHTCSAKALDRVFKVQLTPTAEKLRRLFYNTFTMTDHNLHFYALAGPDFVMGPDAPVAQRNILGIIDKVGLEVAGKFVTMRKYCSELVTMLGGKYVHPVGCIPGGMSAGLDEDQRKRCVEIAEYCVEFAKFSFQLFDDVVLKNRGYVDLVVNPAYAHKTYYMGLVTPDNKVEVYDGDLRVVDPDGKEFVRFKTDNYLDHIAEHVEPWSYLKFPYLKAIGWKGFVDGKDSGVYRVAPLAQLNAADGMKTPIAQSEYEKFYSTLGGKPVHATLATNWARLIEACQAAEEMLILANDESITGDDYRTIPTETPGEGIGVLEAPRGVLIHHYWADEKGIAKKINLIVATGHNNAAIDMSIRDAAKGVIKGDGEVPEPLLNMVEMAFRAYDPCLACATHSMPGQMPLIVNLRDKDGNIVDTIRRD
jgi:F420-non-reducing hydrogenase large subunit